MARAPPTRSAVNLVSISLVTVISVHRALVLRFRGPGCGGIVPRARRGS